MNDTRISQLNVASPLSGGEYIPITQLDNETNVLRTLYTNPDALKLFVFGTVDVFCPVGNIITYAGSVSSADFPNGWLLCNGQSILRSTYKKLFDKIGTTYGSDDTATFKVPNLRGRVVRGYCDTATSTNFSDVYGGNWPASSTVSLGDTGGEFSHRLTSAEIPIQQVSITAGTPNIFETQYRTTYSTVVEQTVVPGPAVTKQLYYRYQDCCAKTSWTDVIASATIAAAYGGSVPSVLSLSFEFTQCEVSVTDAGSWISVGSTGNNNSIVVNKDVRPDSNGNISVRIEDRIWGGHGLRVKAVVSTSKTVSTSRQIATQVPVQVPVQVPMTTTYVGSQAAPNSSIPISISQPYMVMNYIIKY